MTRLLIAAVSALIFLTRSVGADESSRREARVTQLIREVNLLPPDAPVRRAVLNENVREPTAVKTGGESRAELTFVDLTITRLGANTLYRFKKAGREADLESGSILLRVPKDSGGGTVNTSSITAGSTGTTFIFESTRGGGARLTVLEGSARLTLAKHPEQTRGVAAGQAVEVPPGATRIPEPKAVDLERLLKTSPLIVGFVLERVGALVAGAVRDDERVLVEHLHEAGQIALRRHIATPVRASGGDQRER